jgi:hypothetical protein
MTEYSPDVVFNAGAPIDVNKLNQLQRNITSVYQNNSQLINTTNATVGNLQKEVRVFPIVDVGSEEFTVKGGECISKVISFTNSNFTEKPIIVASVTSNIKADSKLTVRATTISTSQARIEVCSDSKDLQTPVINYIAIQMKVID